MSLWRTLLLGALLALSSTTAGYAQKKSTTQPEETGFCGDDLPKHLVPVPKDVLKLLLAREDVQDALSLATNEQKAHPSRYLHAAEIHLGPEDETDLVIIGSSPLSGADNDWFWIVRAPNKNPKIVFWEGASCIYIGTNRTNGFRDISSIWASASEQKRVIYRFNGSEYKAGKAKWSKNNYH